MDEGRWPRKVRAATVVGHQRKRRPSLGWIDGVKSALAAKEVGLQEAT